jgi:hypothetical protein
MQVVRQHYARDSAGIRRVSLLWVFVKIQWYLVIMTAVSTIAALIFLSIGKRNIIKH